MIIGGLLTIPALTGPAYRVTIPACLAITALRRKTHDDLFDDHQNIMSYRGNNRGPLFIKEKVQSVFS